VVKGQACFPLLVTAAITHTINPQLIYTTGNGMCGKLIVYGCTRAEVGILISIQPHPVLTEDITLVHSGGK